jgi:hypothetical protein
MLHPITCEILCEGDKHDRAVQREAFQLQSKLGAAGVKYPRLFVQCASVLGTLLVAMGARLIAWQIPPGSQIPGNARG